MKYSKLLPVLMLLGFSCMKKENVDLVLYNGTIYTVDASFSVVEAMAVNGGRIQALGTAEEILHHYRAGKAVDLEGRYVFPGFIDAHCHFINYGRSLLQADFRGTASFGEVIGRLKEKQKSLSTEWILGRGWDQNDWKVKEFPSRETLDEAFPGRPVLLTRIDGHAALASTEALRRAGIDKQTSVEGGALIRENGELTGMLIDNAIDLVTAVIPSPDRQELIRALFKAQANCFAAGLTSVHEAGLGYRDIDMIDSLQKSGDLKLRIYAMLAPGGDNYEHYLYPGKHKTDLLNVRSIKLYADGALGSRGALLLEPYSDDPGNAGLALSSRDFLSRQCSLALENGFQVNTHAIGDSANRLMLTIYAGFLKGNNDLRWRIEHAQVVDPGDLDRFGQYSIIPSVQSTHATSDMYWAEERLGPERIKTAYAYRQLMEQNGWIPNGSDFPVESIRPLYGFYALCVRKDLEGFPEGGFQTENSLNREDALRAMTVWAARAAFEEDEKGSLEPGKMADFVIADRDILKIPPERIPETRVLQTWLAGERVYPAP